MNDPDEDSRGSIRAALDPNRREVAEQNMPIVHDKAGKLFSRPLAHSQDRQTAERKQMSDWARHVINPAMNEGFVLDGLPHSPRDLLEDS